MARKQRGAEKRSHTTDDRERDRRQITRRVELHRRRVLERQHSQHQGQDRDPGDNPKQRSPTARLRLQSPDERPQRPAPKMHMFMITAVSRNLCGGYPIASGGTAAINSRLVHSPWITRPAMYMPES